MSETTDDLNVTVGPADSIAAITIYTGQTADNVEDHPPTVYLSAEMRGAQPYHIEEIRRAAELQIFMGDVVGEVIKRLQTRELSSRVSETVGYDTCFRIEKVYHFENDKGKKAAVDIIKEVVLEVLNDMQVEAKLAEYEREPQRSVG